MKMRCAIIGAGAAGCFAAIAIKSAATSISTVSSCFIYSIYCPVISDMGKLSI